MDPGKDPAVHEMDTFTCYHCQRIVHVRPREDPANVGGLCKACMRLICPPCVEAGSCTPWEKQMEIIEKRFESRRSMGLE